MVIQYDIVPDIYHSSFNPFTTGHFDNFSVAKLRNWVHLLNKSPKI